MREALVVNRVALVEDDAELGRAMRQFLKLAGFSVEPFTRAQAALDALDANWPGIVVTDVRMPGLSGIDLFHALHERAPELPVLLITGHGDVDMAVSLLKAGAWDFLSKPFSPDTLVAACTRALKARGLTLENRRLREEAADETAPDLIGESPAIRRLREMIPILADADIDILIEGETGTGKDLLARLIHRAGKRAGQRFVRLSCTGIDEALAARTFGPAPDPLVLSADKGVLYLNDLDRAPDWLQDRLTAFVESRTVNTERNVVPVDLRVIASSQPVADGAEPTIHSALFYRLAALRLVLPPLRERREDAPALFMRFALECAERLGRSVPPLTDAVRARLAGHDWPGNVRELRNYAELFVMDLSPDTAGGTPIGGGDGGQGDVRGLTERVDAFEREQIVAAVLAAGGEIGAAIRALGLARKTFYYKVSKHGIDLTALRNQATRG